MIDSVLNDPGIKIDTRSLNAHAAARGAIRRFLWWLIVAVPGALAAYHTPVAELLWALFAFVTAWSMWSVVAAFVNIGRTHERTFSTARQEPIDARHLVARGAMRGAIGGFCWSLLVALPMAAAVWYEPFGGPVVAVILVGSICSVWTGAAALAEKRRTREKTFTDEQRDVLRHHLRRTRIQAACVSVLLIALAAAISGSSPLVVPLAFWVVFSITISSDLVGRAKGNAAVRRMQQETRDAACLINDQPLAVANDAPSSTLVQPSIIRFTENRPAATLEDD